MKRFTPPMAAATVAAMVWSVAPAAEPASTDTEGRLDAVEVSALPLGSDANLTPARGSVRFAAGQRRQSDAGFVRPA